MARSNVKGSTTAASNPTVLNQSMRWAFVESRSGADSGRRTLSGAGSKVSAEAKVIVSAKAETQKPMSLVNPGLRASKNHAVKVWRKLMAKAAVRKSAEEPLKAPK